MSSDKKFADIQGRVDTKGMTLPDFKDFVSLKINNSSLKSITEEKISEADFSNPETIYDKEIKARKKVNKALLWITTQKGFFAQLLSKLSIYGSSDDNYPTMCTNGFNIQYHPDFVLSQSDGAIRFVLCHEVLHCVGDHMSRRGGRDPLLWNYACDYAINPILNSEIEGAAFSWPQNPDGSRMGLYEEKYEGMKAEDIYDLLIKDIEQQKKAKKSFEGDPSEGIHVVDSEKDLGEPDPESIVQDVTGEEGEEGEEEKKPSGPGKPGDKKGEGEPEKGTGGTPEEGGGEGGEGGEGSALIGKKVRITSGPDAGKIGKIKQVLPDGDIIIEPV